MDRGRDGHSEVISLPTLGTGENILGVGEKRVASRRTTEPGTRNGVEMFDEKKVRPGEEEV